MQTRKRRQKISIKREIGKLFFINIECLACPNCTKNTDLHPRVISNALAKFDVNLMDGCGAMEGTDRQMESFLAFIDT